MLLGPLSTAADLWPGCCASAGYLPEQLLSAVHNAHDLLRRPHCTGPCQPLQRTLSHHVQVSHETPLPTMHGSQGVVVGDNLSAGEGGGANTGMLCRDV